MSCRTGARAWGGAFVAGVGLCGGAPDGRERDSRSCGEDGLDELHDLVDDGVGGDAAGGAEPFFGGAVNGPAEGGGEHLGGDAGGGWVEGEALEQHGADDGDDGGFHVGKLADALRAGSGGEVVADT